MIYLDNAATTPVRREVLHALWPQLADGFGNPSSHHQVGEAAAATLQWSRATIATVLGCRATEIVFTSGGTEADNLSIKGIALGSPKGRHVITTRIEHEAVLESCDYLRRLHGFEIDFLDPDADGLVDPEQLRRLIRPGTSLVSVQYASNEVGTVQPIRELTEITGMGGVPFHTDAVQAAGWLPIDVGALGVHALSFSGHKIGAPPGIGAAYLRRRMPIEPLMHGGGQERGRRSGTENVAGALGLATALRLAELERTDAAPRLTALRDTFIAAVLARTPAARLTGHPTRRLPGSASFVFAGSSGEAILLELEQRGIVCSSGSACAAGSDEPSHVLTAMGIPADEARTAVRFTLAADTSLHDTVQAASAVHDAVVAVQRLAPQ